eukprot:TRINITY_DN8446_c0_g1_i2.p1 TRINITY_DN8446_c0_g1~~TRINITY_DN8446_c0_g1_i2.p1  ORF type:complete len:612 (+),score=159.38 TRINITY_DN8446_c0_g1_i2:71-1906(+)
MDDELEGKWCYVDSDTGATCSFEIVLDRDEAAMTISSATMGGGFPAARVTPAGESIVATSLAADWAAELGGDGGKLWIKKTGGKSGFVVLTVYHKTAMQCAVSAKLFSELVGTWQQIGGPGTVAPASPRSYDIQPVVGSLEYREHGYGSGMVTYCPLVANAPRGFAFRVNLITAAANGAACDEQPLRRVMDEVVWLSPAGTSAEPELNTLRQRTSGDGVVTEITERAVRAVAESSANPLILPLRTQSAYDLVAERTLQRTRDTSSALLSPPLSHACSPGHAQSRTQASPSAASTATFMKPKRYKVGDMPAPPPKEPTKEETAKERRERLGMSVQGKKEMRKKVLSQMRADRQNTYSSRDTEGTPVRTRSPKRTLSPNALTREISGRPSNGTRTSPGGQGSPGFCSSKDPTLPYDEDLVLQRGEDVEVLKGDTWTHAVVKRVKLDGTGFEVLVAGAVAPVVYSSRSRAIRRVAQEGRKLSPRPGSVGRSPSPPPAEGRRTRSPVVERRHSPGAVERRPAARTPNASPIFRSTTPPGKPRKHLPLGGKADPPERCSRSRQTYSYQSHKSHRNASFSPGAQLPPAHTSEPTDVYKPRACFAPAVPVPIIRGVMC